MTHATHPTWLRRVFLRPGAPSTDAPPPAGSARSPRADRALEDARRWLEMREAEFARRLEERRHAATLTDG